MNIRSAYIKPKWTKIDMQAEAYLMSAQLATLTRPENDTDQGWHGPKMTRPKDDTAQRYSPQMARPKDYIAIEQARTD